MTSVLLEREKDTVIDDLLNRLCTLRAIDLKSIKVYNDHGKKVDRTQTVGASGLVFLELLDKNEKKKKVVEKKSLPVVIKKHPRPESAGPLKIGEACYVPLKDQLYPEEWQKLEQFKEQCTITKLYSDEFVVACLFGRKWDFKRTTELLEKNLQWRKANNLMNIPSIEDFSGILEKMTITFQVPGSRDKEGCGISYTIFDEKMEIGKEPFTVPTMKKWIAWFYYVGVFHEGMDFFRNGVTIIEDLSGFGWKHFDIDFQKQMSSVWEDTFPMRLKRILILHPPIIFGAIGKLCKTFVKGKILDRMEIVDKSKDLKKWVDEDQLVKEFEGEVQYDRIKWIQLLKEWAEKMNRDC